MNTCPRRDHFESEVDFECPEALYRCHKVARQCVVCSVPFKAPKNDDMGRLVRYCHARCRDDLPTYGARTASYRLPSLPTSSALSLGACRRRMWGQHDMVRSGDFGGGWVSVHAGEASYHYHTPTQACTRISLIRSEALAAAVRTGR